GMARDDLENGAPDAAALPAPVLDHQKPAAEEKPETGAVETDGEPERQTEQSLRRSGGLQYSAGHFAPTLTTGFRAAPGIPMRRRNCQRSRPHPSSGPYHSGAPSRDLEGATERSHPMAQYDFSEKVAIVTGGASGIGKAVVEKLAEGGAKVVVADFDEVGGKATVDKINADGGTASFFKVDVANVEEVEAMVRFAVDTYGGLHIAVNNAGIGGASAPTGEYGIEDWNRVIDINLNGVFYGLRYQIPAMLESGGGSIVNIASILG